MRINIHGGHNHIVQGASGCFSEVAEDRKVKDKVIKYLRDAGHTVYDCTDDSGNTANGNLKNIVSKCNAHTVDLDVSIHFNAYNGSAHGTEVWVHTGSTIMATAKRIANNIASLGFTNRGVKDTTSLYVIKNTNAPALLIECCFCDSAIDAKIYNADKMAKAIAEGIMNNSISGNDANIHTQSVSQSTSTQTVIKKAWLQTDYPNISYTTPKGTPQGATVSSGGCGFVSVLNILYNYLSMTNLGIYDIRDIAISSGARYDYGNGNSGTSVGVLLEACRNKFNNFTYKYTTSDSELKAHLKNGGFAVMRTAGGSNGASYLFSGSGHFVCACGFKDNKVKVIDSYYYSGKWSQYSVRTNNITTTDTRGLVYANYSAVATACDYYYLVSKIEQPKQMKTIDKCSIRKSNSSDSTKLGTMNDGVKIHIESITDNWIETYGYIPRNHCDLSDKEKSAKTIKDCILRSKNSSSSDELGKIEQNIRVDVVDTTSNWIKIKFFVPKKYCK